MPSPSRILRIARASAHSTCGWLAYRLGWQRTAHRQFEKVLVLRGADFRAYVHLGRIAFDQGDYASWRREFEHARRTDPVRFARLRHPMELFEPRLAGTQFEGRHEHNGYHATSARATWRALHPFGPDALGGPDAIGPDALRLGSARRAGGGAPGQLPGGQLPGGDLEDNRLSEGFGHSTDLPLAPGFDPLGFDQLESTSADGASSSNRLDDLMADDLQDGGSTTDGLDSQDEGADENEKPAPKAGAPKAGDRPSLPPTPSMPDALLTRDDFASAAERRRFQLRRPIDLQEIARCDVNDLARRLSS